ncbi:MAG TPA: hypothetical protein VFQ16_16185 [Burkholderiaceae bacterium]|nr:hypothetical protein [Burkholderiaceae bacterium]
MNALRGGCHCGNVGFTLLTQQSERSLVPRRCGCTMCRRHGASWISDPQATLELNCLDPARVSVYQFGQRTSHWILCSRCGVLTAAISMIEGRLRAVVRSQSMVDHHFSAPEVATDFDDEPMEGRLARRSRTWIGSVTISPPLQLQFAP